MKEKAWPCPVPSEFEQTRRPTYMPGNSTCNAQEKIGPIETKQSGTIIVSTCVVVRERERERSEYSCLSIEAYLKKCKQ